MADTPGHMHINAYTHIHTHAHTHTQAKKSSCIRAKKKKIAEYLITGGERIVGVMHKISRKMTTDPII